jgi:LPS O-antigen subunit length determinant protein (WzzB/FepE family)
MNNIAMTKLTEEAMEHSEDEISLLDIIQFFIDNKLHIAISTFACGALGLAYGLITPPKYEASMSLQMAVVANTPVEAPAVLLEKMKLPTYFSVGTLNACKMTDSTNPGADLSKQLKPLVNKNAPFITTSFRAPSTDEAKTCLQAVLADVRSQQKILAEPIIKQKQTYLATLKDKLESAEQVAKFLALQKQDFQFKDDKFSANALVLATRLSKDNEVKDLRNQIVDLELALSEPQTRETFLAAPMFSSPHKVAPSRSLILAIALMAGFMLGVFGVLGRKAWVSIKPKLHASK